MSRFFLLFLCFLMIKTVYADPLLLTPQEMQKLKKYFPSDDNTHYVWKGDAIEIALPLNQEKRIIFPSKVIPDLKGALTTDQLRLINDNKSLYLTAKKPFSHIRMYVTVENSNQVILMDLSTDKDADNSTAYVDFTANTQDNPKNTLTTNMINNRVENNSDNSTVVSDNDNYVTLMRFAWQQLYVPTNLLNNPLNISRAPMHTAYMISDFVYGDKVYAHPIASWTVQNNYVTAIELRNKYPHETHINISRDLCGNWQAASLYPRTTLMPAGNQQSDNTVLFLISQKPFGDAMEVCHGGA